MMTYVDAQTGELVISSWEIPLSEAMFAWNRKTKRVKIIQHPDTNGLFKTFDVNSDIGAAYGSWDELNTHERIAKFTQKAFDLIIQHGFDASHIIDELSVIPEIRPYLKSK